MASPQKENGYTPIANEILEALAHTDLTKYEYKSLFLIYRMTYGYQRLTWELDKWNIFESIGIKKTHIKRTIQSLADKDHIKVNFKEKTITILKDYEKWDIKLPIQVTKKVTNSGNFSELDEKIVTNSGNQKLPIQVTKVTNSGNLMPSKANDSNDSQDTKERKKEKKYIYNGQARLLRELIVAKYDIENPLENRNIPTLQFLIDLQNEYDLEYIKQKINELPNVIEHKEISRTLRSWCEHPEKRNTKSQSPSYHEIVTPSEIKTLSPEEQAFEDAGRELRLRLRAENRSPEYIRDAMEVFINENKPKE